MECFKGILVKWPWFKEKAFRTNKVQANIVTVGIGNGCWA